ncbi:helix-turn-helix transcriptional regulator [Azoarcus sp. DN11]|uniref:AraC family transcriptional regulator n=1 Tax=Azoarcus sp. DN11 TaxID=356837 RepID=UPI000EAE3F78|nr:helix-turn-helix transcriptional regulator [Azoarcus sp. DN11]AYH43989.1 AraC family transcriptional regulator [Azoarcus sp. DN11]
MKHFRNMQRMEPQGEHLPAPIHFRATALPANTLFPMHKHAGGEFVYSFRGVMEIQVEREHFLAPPQYGVWLPPGVAHVGLNRNEAGYCSLYVAAPLCDRLPRNPCALAVSPLIVALLDHLRLQAPDTLRDAENTRLLQVLVDQLAHAPCAGSYLPSSSDPSLGAVLRFLDTHPDDNRTMAELARLANTTERTLLRRAQRDLGMPLSEWRQRLRILKAMPLLAAGRTVEAVALELGYASASAFIAMFRRLMQQTPAEFRKGRG